MKIAELITLAESKLAALNTAIATATAIGDVEELKRLVASSDETQATLDKLRQVAE